MVKRSPAANKRPTNEVTKSMKYFPFTSPWIRLDVDEALSLKNRKITAGLNLLRIKTGLPIPFFLNAVKETKRLLSNYPNVPRMWFFRWFNCPKEFNELFGLHVTKPETFDREYQVVRSKLGKFRYFTRHGFSKRASGRIWKVEEIRYFEKKYNLEDLSDLPHFTVSRGNLETLNLSDLNHILFHPYLIISYKDTLNRILDEMTSKGARIFS